MRVRVTAVSVEREMTHKLNIGNYESIQPSVRVAMELAVLDNDSTTTVDIEELSKVVQSLFQQEVKAANEDLSIQLKQLWDDTAIDELKDVIRRRKLKGDSYADAKAYYSAITEGRK